MSNNLDLTQVAESQDNADVAINDKGGELDAALTESLAVDVTSGNATVTSSDYRRAVRLLVSGASVARQVTLPAVKRAIMVEADAANSDDITVVRGATSFTLSPGSASWFFTDGTTDGLSQIGGAGGGGSQPFDLGIYLLTKPGAGAVVLRFNAVRSFDLPSGLSGSLFTAEVASTGTATFTLKKNGSSIGTVVFTSSATGAATFASPVNFAVNDVFTIEAPGSQDATLEGIALNFKGTR